MSKPGISKHSNAPSSASAGAADRWAYDAKIDALGSRCPIPVLKARKALNALRTGERLVVEASDPMAAIDFPHYCSESGHRLIATETDQETFRFLIEKA